MKSRTVFFISVVIFTAFLFIIPRQFISPDYGNTVLTISTFLFSIFAGFCILVTTTDYNSVRGLAADETAHWISLYGTVSVYMPEKLGELKGLIGRYMIRAFDYDFLDYARNTKPEFAEVGKFIFGLPVTAERSSVHQNVMDRMSDLTVARQHLTALGKRSLSSLEWIVLFVLAAIVIVTLYGLRTGDLFFDVVAVTVASTIVLILVLTHAIDRYVWNEATFSFEVYNNVLLTLGELPYYPAELLEDGIVVPREKEYRIGTLLNPGKSWERKIEIHRAT